MTRLLTLPQHSACAGAAPCGVIVQQVGEQERCRWKMSNPTTCCRWSERRAGRPWPAPVGAARAACRLAGRRPTAAIRWTSCIETSRHRISSLLPIRYGRMQKSPFAFLRGSAAVMAADLATTPTSGIWVQSCGDCHLANFGIYAAPDGTPVFDVTDFDETLPAPFEWDLKRLAASVAVDARGSRMPERACRDLARGVVAAYRQHMTKLMRLDPLSSLVVARGCDKRVAGIDDAKLRAARTEAVAHRRRSASQGLSQAAGAPQDPAGASGRSRRCLPPFRPARRHARGGRPHRIRSIQDEPAGRSRQCCSIATG